MDRHTILIGTYYLWMHYTLSGKGGEGGQIILKGDIVS